MKKRLTAITLIMAMLFSLLPISPTEHSYAAASETISSSLGFSLVNATHMSFWNNWFSSSEHDAFSAIRRWGNEGKGITWYSEDGDPPEFDGIERVNGVFSGKFYINQIPELKRLAESGQAHVLVRAGTVDSTTDDDASIYLKINGSSVWGVKSKSSDKNDLYNQYSGWHSFGPNDVVEVYTLTDGANTKVSKIELYFADINRPTYNGNTLTHNGTVRYNNQLGKNELFLREGQYANLALNFSEPVLPADAISASEMTNGSFNLMQVPLYENAGGDGYEPSNYVLKNIDNPYSSFTTDSLKRPYPTQTTYNMRYSVGKNDTTYNTPIDPERITNQLVSKINEANFIDGAGNGLVDISSIGTVPFGNNSIEGTYRTIVDARPPAYSKVANGVQPDILTGMVVNEGDKIKFLVNFNEMVIPVYDLAGTRLVFNNGMIANYVSGSNTSQWTFEANISGSAAIETSQLEVVALTHSSKNSDGGVIQDYAGNLLDEAVKSIKWANLAVDNTAPIFNNVFTGGEPTGAKYRKSGDIQVNVNDPDLAGAKSPGVFGPNGTGDGMFYYFWSQTEDDPLAGKANDYFAAVKRFAMTLKQPQEDLYPNQMDGFNIQVSNNRETIPMPEAAKTAPGNTGKWYLHLWSADKTWDSARQLMQYAKGKNDVDTYKTSHPEATVNDIEKYFREQVLPNLGQYDNLSQWPLTDYKQNDSNWVHQVAILKLDNTAPVIQVSDILDNNSDELNAKITATDAESTIDSYYYQFVLDGEEPSESAWALLDGQGKSVNTKIFAKNNPMIKKSGDYWIHTKAVDEAGNEILGEPVKVRILKILTSFAPNTNAFIRNDGINFKISGLPIGEVSYAYAGSSARPTDWTLVEDKDKTEAGEYQLAKDYTKNGTWFIHFKVKQEDSGRLYYYFKEYKMDHLPPTVTFSSQGFLYPLPEQETTITVKDTLVDAAGVSTKNVKYQWVKVEEGKSSVEPDPEKPGWKQMPEGGKIKLTSDSKAADGDYKLYVYASDSLTNAKMYSISSLFSVYYLSKEKPEGTATLIQVENDPELGAVAVVKVDVDVPNKHGYTYSSSSDGGKTWTKWRPYSNYVGVLVDDLDPKKALSLVKVKFKGLYGNVSDSISPKEGLVDDKAYAVASLSTIEPVMGGAKIVDGGGNPGIEIGFRLAEDKTIKATPRNIEVPEVVEVNKTFRVYQNGYYNFEVKDSKGSSNIVSIVVSNFDTEAPVASISYNETAPTNGNVLAILKTSEPVRITSEGNSFKRTFTDNGTYTFEFEDAVGHKGTMTATVENIDKTPPEVALIYLYNHPETKALISYNGSEQVVDVEGEGFDANGILKQFEKPSESNVIASNRMTVEVVNLKDPTAPKAFYVVRNSMGTKDTGLDVKKNGVVTFVVEDEAGNMTSIESKEITHLSGVGPTINKVNLRLVDDKGNPIPADQTVEIDGKSYFKGKIEATIDAVSVSGKAFVGATPVESFKRLYSKNGAVSLNVSDQLGNSSQASFEITGIDGEAPKITLTQGYASIVKNQADFNPYFDLGGYEVSDNISKPENLVVSIFERVRTDAGTIDQELDITKVGTHQVIYRVEDQVGNVTEAKQALYVLNNAGMKLYADGKLLTEKADQTAIIKGLSFKLDVVDYDLMEILPGAPALTNSLATYDLAYFPGLYRQGQMKYIAKKMTMKELTDGNFMLTVEKPGWYTIVLTNQERETIYVSVLVTK